MPRSPSNPYEIAARERKVSKMTPILIRLGIPACALDLMLEFHDSPESEAFRQGVELVAHVNPSSLITWREVAKRLHFLEEWTPPADPFEGLS